MRGAECYGKGVIAPEVGQAISYSWDRLRKMKKEEDKNREKKVDVGLILETNKTR